MEATTNSLRRRKGFGDKVVSRWQLGVLVECMSVSCACVVRAFEWCLEVISNELGRGGGVSWLLFQRYSIGVFGGDAGCCE